MGEQKIKISKQQLKDYAKDSVVNVGWDYNVKISTVIKYSLGKDFKDEFGRRATDTEKVFLEKYIREYYKKELLRTFGVVKRTAHKWTNVNSLLDILLGESDGEVEFLALDVLTKDERVKLLYEIIDKIVEKEK